MSDAPASRCGSPTRRSRLVTAAAMVALAAVVGPAPWVAEAFGLASTGSGEAGTIVPVGIAVALVAIAAVDVVVAAVSLVHGPRRRTPRPRDLGRAEPRHVA